MEHEAHRPVRAKRRLHDDERSSGLDEGPAACQAVPRARHGCLSAAAHEMVEHGSYDNIPESAVDVGDQILVENRTAIGLAARNRRDALVEVCGADVNAGKVSDRSVLRDQSEDVARPAADVQQAGARGCVASKELDNLVVAPERVRRCVLVEVPLRVLVTLRHCLTNCWVLAGSSSHRTLAGDRATKDRARCDLTGCTLRLFSVRWPQRIREALPLRGLRRFRPSAGAIRLRTGRRPRRRDGVHHLGPAGRVPEVCTRCTSSS